MNSISRPPLWLLTLLIMFPQLVETIYSPALPYISNSFGVSHEQASQTLSVYFLAFAFGVVLWGWMSDTIGRRPAIISGLICYGIGTLLAITTTEFKILLFARMVSAVGAAAGSVVVQTMLRDSYESIKLASVFSIMGAALAISPVFGLLSGGWLVSQWGHMGVFIALSSLALLLLILSATLLPETRPMHIPKMQIWTLATRMFHDYSLWQNAMLVALLNTMIFSYYSLAPFLFKQLGWNSETFGCTGLILAFSSLMGSLLNRKLLASKIKPEILINYACHVALLSGLIAWLLQTTFWILIPMTGIVLAYGIAIPNILSQALSHYREHAGKAGAIFGLTYYFMLGCMLSLVGLVQQLGLVLAVCAFITLVFKPKFKPN
ncbi:multidrug effflux MFS transporter [Acinetobacter gyllenbergii]|uniref:multidrug effflux MFS transporter n=1 Tax=Acinetobacter gyllenbergii TaxID=134534 RepID=UPI0021D357AC|nr:multidrug effflux MFS transporter [Acinetobacter gyllenbergii]MCU4582881.1 multidrug effflux MFS transporter [Acinetobacter gyllenbergii]